ncbi:MAG TPA: hypothetical protein VN944_11915, partial [Nitrospiria bacterium]|nr:hypothetical protein [Nitrospiria bacterium]
MSQPKGSERKKEGLSASPLPSSKKIFVKGSLTGLNVPMREIQLSKDSLVV